MSEFDKNENRKLRRQIELLTNELEKYKGSKLYTAEELFGITRDDQVAIIRLFDPTIKIPKTEKDRVNLILKIQGGKS